jgi:Fe-S-cluster containining protein
MKPIRRRKPKKLYKTVITLKPPKHLNKVDSGPEIEIDTTTLRPKLLGSQVKPRGLKKGANKSKLDSDEKPFKMAKRYDEKLIQRMEWIPVKKSTHWKCKRCGWCCSHEWRVNLTWHEYDRLKEKLPIEQVVVDKKSGMSHPFFSIKDKCAQYDSKSHKCKIYKERAYSCATFPFAISPEGKLIRSKFCKGFGSGPLVEKSKMRQDIFKWRKRAGMRI